MSTMAYRRERSSRDPYDDRYIPERTIMYPRAAGPGERRGPFGRPEDDYGRGGYEYDGGPRFFPNGGGPRNYHNEDQRGYHADNMHFPAERRAVPPSRRQEDYPYRGPREEPHTGGRPMEFANTRAQPPHNARSQGIYPAPRSLPEGGSDDTLMQAILNLDRGEDRDPFRRKAAPFPPIRERSPARREVPHSPHSRSGSSVSSRGYSPDRTKALPFTPQPGRNKAPGPSRDGSPQSTVSNKEEIVPAEKEKEEPVVPAAVEESHKSTDDFQERRAQAISAKAREIEMVYRQDCETFGMVVKMLVAKDPNLEKQLQVPLRENLGEIRERCLEDLKHFINELDEVVRQIEPPV